jgi:tripartite-type tricarboxylate transporter receptor subunit TctC
MSSRRGWLGVRIGIGVSIVALACLLPAAACSQPVDDKAPIRLLVGLAPGGSNDIAARILAEKLKDLLNRTVIVDSRLGAGQRVALTELKRSPPDGRTLMLATNSPFTIYPHIYAKLDYDPVKDFTPIAGVMKFDMGVAGGPKVNAATLKDWVAWARAHPAEASYGTPGAGTLPHFLGVAFAQAIGVDMPQVPYKGGSPAMTDLAGGQLPILINGLSDMLEMHRAGKIRVLATTGEKRSTLLPEVPTLMESGVNVSSVITVGIFGPPGMAPELVRRLNTAITQAVTAPDVLDRFSKYGLVPATAQPQELAATLAAESARLAVLVKASGYKPE